MLGALGVFIENVVFWGFVYIIVFMGCETPAIVFTGFSFFLVYWFFRYVSKQEGSDRFLWLHVTNMIASILLLYYFVVGASFTTSLRSFMNSTIRKYPSMEPYLKRC
jgi:hypothetical protein